VAVTVMVVEGEALTAYEIERALTALGYEVSAVVASGEEALVCVPHTRPRVALIDVDLAGGLDGITTGRELRERYDIPVVFVTSDDDLHTLMDDKQANPYGCVLKPFKPMEFASAIEIALHRHRVEQELQRKTALLEAVLQSMEDAVIAADERGRLLVFNEAASEMFGGGFSAKRSSGGSGIYSADQLTPCPARELPLLSAMLGDTVRGHELFVRGSEFPSGSWHSVNATPLRLNDGSLGGGVMVSRNVTRLKLMEKELRKLSDTDPLTGTYNRRGFVSKAQQQLKRLQGEGRRSELLFVDLNGMKTINDSLGHAEGDQAIVDVTSVLKGCFTERDIVGRLGGDEFAILVVDERDARSVAEDLYSTVETFNSAQSRRYRLSISVGSCTYDPASPMPIDLMLERADQDMYRDKQRRKRKRREHLDQG